MLISNSQIGDGFAPDYSIAELFVKRGNNLLLIARRKSVLLDISSNFEKLYQVKVLTIACELSVKDPPKSIYERCKNESIVIDTIVNNAEHFFQFINYFRYSLGVI